MSVVEKRLKIRTPTEMLLAGVLHQPGWPGGTGVVICHGMMSSKDSPKHKGIAAALAERGHMALRFDFSGRGESPGTLLGLTFARQVIECRAAVAELRRTGVSKIALVGSSMGGAVAALTATREPLVALATMATVGRTDLLPERAVGKDGLEKWKRDQFIEVEGEKVGYALVEDARRINLPAEAKKIKCPWLILHGELDEVIPVEDSQILYEAAQGAVLEIVAGADHGFSGEEHREFITNRIVDFLDGKLKK
jgi:pimeloyl-ACP methyl ester carboxylesterase